MPISTREAYGQALVDLADRYDFVVLDADLSKATQTTLFAKAHPDRFFNMGIAEGNMMTVAAGMAACGETVFASSFAVFAAGRAFEQVRNSVAYTRLNVKVAATHGGVLIGQDGGSHQAVEDLSLMRTLPNMTVIAPCDAVSAKKAVEAALGIDGPVYLRFGRFAPDADVYTEDNAPFTVGKGNVLREGSDVAIFAIGDLVCMALQAAEELDKQGIRATVVDMHTIKPLDRELVLRLAEKTGHVVTAEDHSVIGGLGSAVAEVLSERPVASLRRVGLNDCFGVTGSRAELAEHFGLTPGHIAQACRDCLNG
ncbi:transketolase family protein [Candidatus Allofournierella excrementavium]|uniref:transketolase family protein n=1 Tax=Candidatus Allofournierella excrementavium TaxID=2838591 RepID=UPI003AB23C56